MLTWHPDVLRGAESNGLRLQGEAWTAFVEDIRANGIREPITVLFDSETRRIRLVNGNHRLAAAREVGISVPVRLKLGLLPYDVGIPLPEGDLVNEDVTVIRSCIDYLYARIADPSASDLARRRIAQKAVDRLEKSQTGGEQVDLAGMTIAQIQTLVEDGDVTAAEALEFEQVDRQRSTLISWLEERI